MALRKLTTVPLLQDMRHIHETFNLPTEVVVCEPEIIQPRQGRVYKTSLYLRGGRVINYDKLRNLDDFNGTMHETEVLLYEVWADLGPDGHELMGWMYLPDDLNDLDPLDIYNYTNESGELV